MNDALRALHFSACVFGIMGFAHFLLLIGGSSLSIGSLEIAPLWSLPACLLLVCLCGWMQHLAAGLEHGEHHRLPPPLSYWP